MGDLLLIEVAKRLIACVREVDTVSRFGGDEFVVLLTDLNVSKDESKEQARVIAEKIRCALAEPYLLATNNGGTSNTTVCHRCSASIGVTMVLYTEGDVGDILKRADAAMYQAKEEGRNLIRFYEN
jgi:diguanylate cyclase (GGDEF)-like protein